MRLSLKDWPHIKTGGLIFLLTLGFSGVIILSGESYLENTHANQHSSQRQLSEARRQLAGARADRDNMETYTAEYKSLIKNNIIGANQRLDWLEGLEKLRKQRHVLDFKYTISPQQNFVPKSPLDHGSFELKQSTMTLQLDLLHEEQLIRFFNALHAQVKGRYILEQCVLERRATAVDSSSVSAFNTTAQIHATCSGGWLALQNRSAS
ncbi:MAG: hypothetical protein ABL860_03455 [Candidatus Nitrotoga sp.]